MLENKTNLPIIPIYLRDESWIYSSWSIFIIVDSALRDTTALSDYAYVLRAQGLISKLRPVPETLSKSALSLLITIIITSIIIFIFIIINIMILNRNTSLFP